MKNMLLSRNQICIFSDNLRTPLFKVYTRARYKQAKISQNKDDLKGFFFICGYILTPVSVICSEEKKSPFCGYENIGIYFARRPRSYYKRFTSQIMVKRCAWGTCKSDSRYPARLKKDNGTSVSFHSFPSEKKSKERRQIWIMLSRR